MICANKTENFAVAKFHFRHGTFLRDFMVQIEQKFSKYLYKLHVFIFRNKKIKFYTFLYNIDN